jgi:F-type H+-transporting ATPase subunit delta
VRDVPELRAAFRNPQLAPGTKAGIVVEIIGESDPLLSNFLRLVAEKGRMAEIVEIARELDRLMAAEEGRLDVELTTAYELSEPDAKAILKQIQEASGRKVEATRKVDPNLIGGFVLQAGSMRVDASVRGRIERLRRELVTT